MTKGKGAQMIERIKRQNSYILETFEKAIKNISVVSFNIFDTIIIQGFRNESDIIEQVGKSALQICGITNFSVLRLEAQTFADNAAGNAKYIDIYRRVGEIAGNIDVSTIYDAEMKCRCDNLYASPLGKMMYDIARTLNKKVIFLGDSRFSTDVVKVLLKSYGYSENDDVFLSVGNEMSRENARLYAYIRDSMSLDVNGWFHVGNDKNADIDVPRSLGISAMRVDSPMTRYLAAKEENGDNEIETEEEIINRYSECAAFDETSVICAKNVSMVFNMSREKVDNLKEYLIKLIKGKLQFERFSALLNISLEVRKGERVAIIGRNGSGKSTFLKIASGVMKPTSGTMSVKGSIAPMIELGAGFDYELSARENVFLNGAILGYSRHEMEKKYNEIIRFAELETFQDTAIKNFSSGMITRLGFAIATCNIPDILIIDEVLSVGDYAFQKKCQKKIREMTDHGATVLFVSHSAEDIKTICDRAVWLDNGVLKADGEAEYIVDMYINEINE